MAASFGLAALVSGFVFLGFTAFMIPFTKSFDVGRDQISLVFGFSSIAGVAAAPLVGKFGARPVTMVGVTSMGVGLILLSLAQSLLHYAFIHLTLITMGGFVVLFYGSATIVNNWFDKKRGLAFGIVFTGISLGAALVTVVNYLVEGLGWREAALIIGVVGIVVGLPLASLLRERPEDFGMLPDGRRAPTHPAPSVSELKTERGFTLKQALHTPSFWMLSIGFSARNFVIAGMSAHFIPAIEDKGFSSSTGAQMLLVFAFVAGASRVLTAILSDHVRKTRLTALMTAIAGGAFLLLIWADSIALIIVFVLIYSLAWAGSGGGMLSAVRGEFFGRGSYAAISGAGNLVQAGGEFLGPFVAGLLFERTGAYNSAYVVFIGMMGLSTIVMLLTRPPRIPGSKPSPT